MIFPFCHQWITSSGLFDPPQIQPGGNPYENPSGEFYGLTGGRTVDGVLRFVQKLDQIGFLQGFGSPSVGQTINDHFGCFNHMIFTSHSHRIHLRNYPLFPVSPCKSLGLLVSLVPNVGNGWEWGNAIIVDSYCGSFPHSLLSTSKLLKSKIQPKSSHQLLRWLLSDRCAPTSTVKVSRALHPRLIALMRSEGFAKKSGFHGGTPLARWMVCHEKSH